MLPATARLDVAEIERLIEQKSYFVIHAPRQVGKTTAVLYFDLAGFVILTGLKNHKSCPTAV